MVEIENYIDTEETYFLYNTEFTRCCDYPIIWIQNKQRVKIKHCIQCLREIKND